jgi:hypothetical protein
MQSGLEIVATIQIYLDARAAALPQAASAQLQLEQEVEKEKESEKEPEKETLESLDDYPSLGFDFAAVDLAALGADGAPGGDKGDAAAATESAPQAEVPPDPVKEADARFAVILRDTINPKIYRLLSDILAEDPGPAPPPRAPAKGGAGPTTVAAAGAAAAAPAAVNETERNILVSKLTKCWSDCAAVVVLEHKLMVSSLFTLSTNSQDWSAYVGAYGTWSWGRIRSEAGRTQVGLHFMLNVAQHDPHAFYAQEEEFLALFFHSLVADRLTVQHKYVSAVLALPGALDHPLLGGVRTALLAECGNAAPSFSRTQFLDVRPRLLSAVFSNIAPLLSGSTPPETKALVYRAINIIVSALAANEAAIDPRRVLPREGYRAFVGETVHALRSAAGAFVDPFTVPGLRALIWVKM